jgi:hypothetical protein
MELDFLDQYRRRDDEDGWTSSSYKTLLSVSPSGLVSKIIGPESEELASFFEVTVDGHKE